MNVYDLVRGEWESKTIQPEAGGLHSKGAYRSVAVSSRLRTVIPDGTAEGDGLVRHTYSIEEPGGGDGETRFALLRIVR